ncbi:MAG: CDP-glucose 4,6-dehydratase [Desulforhopalus sp.]
MEGVEMNAGFWHGKTVLITGHTGFKGSWLSLLLETGGTQVVGFALAPPSEPNFFEVSNVARGITSLTGDVRSYQQVRSAIQKHRPEIVIHMAAQPLVRYSYEHPLETYETNVMGTANVLEAVRQTNSVRVVLVITSDKCYENKEWPWGYRENEPMGGHDPYSSSKSCAELVATAYRKSYFPREKFSSHRVAIATARAGNVIGGGDWGQDRLVPDIMRAVMQGKAVNIRYPHAVRPWQHVLEPLDGYLRLIEKLWEDGKGFAGGWNFGPESSGCKSVSWMLKTLNGLWKGGVKWEIDENSDNPHEANYLKLDCSKAATKLGWYPRLNLFAALEMVAEWYEGYANNEDMRELSKRQISRYEGLE